MDFGWIANPYIWMGTTGIFLLLFLFLFIFVILLSRRTHAITEFKASFRGVPVCMFFLENRYVDWRPVKPEAGIVTDKDYGAFIVNERATYVDKRTKNVIIPFDAQFGASINVHAAKLADDLQYVMKDDEQLKTLRHCIANNLIDENLQIDVLKTNINIGAIKSMMTALIPHNINAKIEKMVAARIKNFGNVNVPQVILLFAAILGAILLGGLIIKYAFGK